MVGLWVRTVAKGTNTVVLLSIGSFSSGEKMDPEETGTNIYVGACAYMHPV